MTSFASLFQHMQQQAVHGLNVLLPPLCAMCDDRVSESHGFCGGCWNAFTFIAPPLCSCCGIPFEYEGQSINDAALCGGCLIKTPRFNHARSAVVYNDASKSMILPFKHADRTDFSPTLAKLMQHAGKQMIESADMVLPVPLHFMRLFLRRYNQSALLVQHIAKTANKPMLLHALWRKKPTQSQGHLSREQREANVRNAFAVRRKYVAVIKGKNLLLIDDVFTTGATVNACTAALLKAGAARVDVLTLARVVKANV